jgi:hypothetical protein
MAKLASKDERDPIMQTGSAGAAGGGVKNASAGRVRSISGGGPNFSATPGGPMGGGGLPCPESPYKGGK